MGHLLEDEALLGEGLSAKSWQEENWTDPA